MRIRVLAVGTRMPAWVAEGVGEYQKRLPRDFPVDWIEIPPAKRQGESAERLMAKEAEAIRKHLKGDDRLLALDVRGKAVSTEDMATSFQHWQMDGRNLAFIIGGPDGIDPDLLNSATARWSLGRITLPHPLVRVILAEQLYRAWSINAQHPYHRA
jgi:23S rRNA (pseudouridine1915-N3)-methyltransferase